MGRSTPNTCWGMQFVDKIMILQIVKLTIQTLGVGYPNRPKKGQVEGMWHFPHTYTCLALI